MKDLEYLTVFVVDDVWFLDYKLGEKIGKIGEGSAKMVSNFLIAFSQ